MQNVQNLAFDFKSLRDARRILNHVIDMFERADYPNPLLRELPVEHDRRGAVVVDSALAVPGQSGLWAVGDCAAITDAKTGNPKKLFF
jgi:NADH dehydrogenase FAD-containing subunit